MKKTLIDVASMAVCGPVLALLYLVEPFWRLRVCEVPEGRIGTLSNNAEYFLRRLHMDGMPARTTYAMVMHDPANVTLARMIARRMPVVNSKLLRRLVLGARPLLARTRFLEFLPFKSSEHETMSVCEPQLSFTPEEEAAGAAFLRGVGLGPDDWFVCIHCRTPEFIALKNKTSATPTYRDCSIESYVTAAKWVIEQGGWVFRMGSADNTDIGWQHSRLVDYARHHRTDFLDIYLVNKARLFLGSTSGLVCIAHIFNKPTGVANMIELMYCSIGDHALFIPKLLRAETGDGHVPFTELSRQGFMAWVDQTAKEHHSVFALHTAVAERWQENTPEDILDLCKDVYDAIEGKPVDPEARRLQQAYRALYGDSPSAGPHAGRIGPRFALKYRHLIEPEGAAAGETDLTAPPPRARTEASGARADGRLNG